MPFALSPLNHRTNGIITRTPIPLSEYLSVSFDQGVNDSALASIQRMDELNLLERGNIVDKDYANENYGIPGQLEFNEPIHESVAQKMRERKDKEMYREFVLAQGSTGLFSGRGAAGMLAMMAGNIANPLDFALNFIPVVGTEKAAISGAANVARAARFSLARGLVTRQALRRALPGSRSAFMAESFIEGFVGAGVTEIPLFVSNAMDQANYTAKDAILNIGLGGVFNTAINGAVRAAARVFNVLQVSTKESMMKHAMEQLLTGKDVDVGDLAKLDDNAIKQHVRRVNKTANQAEAMKVNPEEIRKTVLDLYRGRLGSIRPVLDFGTETYKVSGIHHIGPHSDFDIHLTQKAGEGERELFVGQPGQTIQELKQKAKVEAHLGRANFLQRDIPKAKALYEVLDKEGKVLRTIDSSKLPEVLGIEEPYIPRDLISEHRVRDLIKKDSDFKRRFLEARKAGATLQQALDEVRDAVRARDHELFFERPEVKEQVNIEKKRRLHEYMKKNKERYEGGRDKKLEEELQKTIDEGHLVSEEDQKKWSVKATNARERLLSTDSIVKEESRFVESLKEQINALKEELKEAEWKDGMPEDTTKDLDAAVQQVIDCLLNPNG